MRKIIEDDLPFTRVEISADEGRGNVRRKEPYKLELLINMKVKKKL